MWFIYLLVDPRVTSGRARDEVRYVGFASDVDLRLLKHIEEAFRKRTRKCLWLRNLLTSGLQPLVRVVDSGYGDSWREAERFWIRFYREAVGANLTNMTDGGEGIFGMRHSEESKRLMSVNRTGHKLVMRQSSYPSKRRVITDEQKRHLSEIAKQRRMTKQLSAA